MSQSLNQPAMSAPREVPDVPRRMAKADLETVRKAETVDYRQQIGEAIKRAARLAGDWSLKELSAQLKRDERQVARWLSGQERAQLDVLWEVEALRGPLVIALAELSSQAEVVTEIRVRRRA